MRKIPRTMSTQHPDNANVPGWVEGEVLAGEKEVFEVYYAFSSLGVEECLWDAEGKDVDLHVVRKLFELYPDFFRERILGRDIFLTYRLPNPWVEVVEKKVFSEVLESIPLASDVASSFYGCRTAPVFEVVLPLTERASQLKFVKGYYEGFVARRSGVRLGSVEVREVLGDVYPETVEVIPLLEDFNALYHPEEVLRGYVEEYKPRYLRVFLARSDPALNYGLLTAVLLVKTAMSRISVLAEEEGLDVYFILGTGPPPFRGGLTPLRVREVLSEYPGVYTYTIQSAFKYDYPEEQVKRAIAVLNNSPVREPPEVSVPERLARRLMSEYQSRVNVLAGIVNEASRAIPSRRARKLHIGLFGYPRAVGGASLPRAIPFTGALYSLGLPPELLGAGVLQSLAEDELSTVEETYKLLRRDYAYACSYVNQEVFQVISALGVPARHIEKLMLDVEVACGSFAEKHSQRIEHTSLSSKFAEELLSGNLQRAKQLAVEMGKLRGFLG
jgi:phosphoenolpyruvate carboxylase